MIICNYPFWYAMRGSLVYPDLVNIIWDKLIDWSSSTYDDLWCMGRIITRCLRIQARRQRSCRQRGHRGILSLFPTWENRNAPSAQHCPKIPKCSCSTSGPRTFLDKCRCAQALPCHCRSHLQPAGHLRHLLHLLLRLTRSRPCRPFFSSYRYFRTPGHIRWNKAP